MDLADRIKWVIDVERVFVSAGAWAKATDDVVHRNTINDLKRGESTNPERATLEALSFATRRGRTGKQVSVAWLAHGIGAPYDAAGDGRDLVYPSRGPVLAALEAAGSPSDVIARLRQVTYPRGGDPGPAHWHRKAAEFLDDFERMQDSARVVRDSRP